LPAEDSAAYCRPLHDDALAQGQPKVAVSALIREADAWRRAGVPERAATAAGNAVAEAAACGWYDIHAPEFWWLAFQALDAGGSANDASTALGRGIDWLQRALPHVPPTCLHGYLNRSAGVAELHAMAKRRNIHD
jgi:hypothetical protein